MTAPRLREQCRPPSPPDRRPPRRGGRPSSQTVSAAARPAGLARLASARRGLVRSAGALAAAACLALSGSLALPATAEAQTCTLNTGDIWCGVVTVGNAGAGSYGFNSGSVGGLTDNSGDRTFTIGTVVHSVEQVIVSSFGLSFKVLRRTDGGLDLPALLDDDRARLVLHIGSDSFAFSVASHNTTLGYEWTDAGLDWSSETRVTVRLREASNTPPVFSETTTTRTVPENSAADTPVGDPVTATDADTLTYTLEETGDHESFDIVSTSGQIQTVTGVEYNHEATKNSYSVTVKASDATASATIDVTITVTDVDEQPDKPAKPTLAAVSGSATSLTATWVKPGLNGGPDITGYQVRYESRAGAPDQWSSVVDWPHTGTTTTTTITGLTADTEYRVDVSALNGETQSAFSISDAVRTNTETTTTTGICDRTQQVQDAIVGLIPSVSNCADVTNAHLADISGLWLPFVGLTALKAGDFDGLTSLDQLLLNNNSLETLPPGVFDGLTALTVLWLPANGLTELPAGVFDDLTALETLFLGDNDLTTLPDDVFDKLTALTWLQLSDNKLTALPSGVFDRLTALTVLELEKNIGLTELPAGVFDNNTALTSLYLANDGLTELPAGVFSGLTSLSWLVLANNSLTELPAGVFDGLTALERLELGHNGLTELPDGVFDNNTALSLLYLDNNSLTELPAGVFSGLTSLTNLSLGGNSTDPMQLTVTMEKVGTDQVRAKVLAGAPFAVDIPVTVVDGTLAGGATTLGVAQGSVDGGPVTVTRTAGTTAAVTVDVDLSTQPTLPAGHAGYAFARASSGLPATVLPVYTARPTVESVAVKSAPQQSSDTYGWGETIVFTLTFSEKVRVTGLPQPKLAFDLGGSTREARYEGMSDTDVDSDPRPRPRPEGVKVHFYYTVQPGDWDSDGIQVGELASAIDLGGARIQSAADLVDADGHKVDGVDANLAHAALGQLRDHKVDARTARPPAGSGVTIIDTDGAPLAGNPIRLTIRESTRGRYGLKLNTQPTHTVRVVAIHSDGDQDLEVLPTAQSEKAITPAEWETPFYMEIGAALDDDEENGERVFLNRVHSQDPAYNDLILPDVIVVEDDSHDDAGALSVADANATEGVDDTLDFVVKLNRKPWRDLKVTVDYRTQNGTATAGSDYTSTSGTLTFAPGEDKKTVSVPIMDDAVEDNGETFTLVLSNPSGAGFASFGQGAVGTIRNAETPALTASFEGVPEAHDGETAFRVRVAFSEGISISYTRMRDASFTVTAGEVTAARRVDGRRDLWEITIEPDSDEAVTVRLPETTDCGASAAICTGDGRGLSHALSATVAGPADAPESNTAATGTPAIGGTAQVGEALTASTSGISDADGLDTASFAYQWMRNDADIGGATGSSYTPVAADEGERLTVRVSFTDDAGNEESLTSAATDGVAAAPEPLTASFEGMPAEHAGQGSFSFRVAFSDGINISYKTVRDASFTVTGGEVTQASRVDSRRDLWKITIEPDADGAVTVRLPETTDCGASGAICTGDGRGLSHALSATVAGPVGVTVADARDGPWRR